MSGSAAVDFWARTLEGAEADQGLCPEYARPPSQMFGRERLRLPIDPGTCSRLAAAVSGTAAASLLAALYVLCLRCHARTDVVLGMLAGRQSQGSEALLACLPVRIRATPHTGAADLLAAVQQALDTGLIARGCTFADLLEVCGAPDEASRAPLFQVLVSVAGPLGFTSEQDAIRVRCDLELSVCGLDGSSEPVSLHCEYDAQLYSASAAARLCHRVLTVLQALLASPNSALARLPLMGPAERALCEAASRGPDRTWAAPVRIEALFDQRVAQSPAAVAVSDERTTLTYEELRSRSVLLAARLRAQGASRGHVVAIALERSTDMLVAVLAVLRTGAAYLPVDLSHPRERVQFVLRDADVRCVVVDGGLPAALAGCGVPLIALSRGHDREPLEVAAPAESQPDDAAYLIYTSGSTGAPKGVLVGHRSVVNFIQSMAERPGFGPHDVLVAVTTLAFDISVLELLLPICSGGQVHIATQAQARDGAALALLLAQHGATMLQATPATWWSLLETQWQPAPGFAALCGGEPLPPELASRLRQRVSCAWNMYGPTETTVWSTCQALSEHDPDAEVRVSVGRPIANTQCYVLDEHLELAPIGVEGTLYIGGAGLALGYYRRASLTAERFVPNPHASESHARMYCTGDRARLRSDGNVEVLGRRDNQVKLRGYRIELEEIEAVLLRHEGVREAAVQVVRRASSDEYLEAYVARAGEGCTVSELRAFLQRSLPAYMVPARVHFVSALPRGPSGKIQRDALPRMAADSPVATTSSQAARGSIERRIAEVWASVLGLPLGDIDRRANFFELGGHSLLMARLQIELEQSFGRRFTRVELFRHPRVELLAQLIAADEAPVDLVGVPLQAAERTGGYAIVGMALRVPGASDVATFWRNLCEGIESIETFDEAQLLATGQPLSLLRQKGYVPAAGTVAEVERFDPEFFGFSQRDAENLDPQHRVFLEIAWEALEDAGLSGECQRLTGGVFASADQSGYFQHHLANHASTWSPAEEFQIRTANDKDYLPTRVSYKLGLTGPSLSVQTACSSSLVAVHVACGALARGECEFALVGGVSLRIPQVRGYVYQDGMPTSPDGHCRAFDAAGSGTIFSSGAGVIVLRPLAHALAERDRVYAVISGSAVNNDGSLKAGYTAPSSEGQARAIALAHRAAGVSADSIGYVEAHGTGTQVGDPIEVQGLTQAFRATTDRVGFCALGSVKTNIGHLDVAAGVVGLIKAALCVHHGVIAKSLHFKRSNPELRLETSPFFVAAHRMDWSPPAGTPRRAGVSSFGIGGTNAHVVVEEAPTALSQDADDVASPLHVLALSAASEPALHARAAAFAEHLERTAARLQDVCHTANARRSHHAFRLLVSGSSRGELVQALRAGVRAQRVHASSRPGKIAFVFGGSGSQWPGMGRDLYASEPVFARSLDACSREISKHMGWSVVDLLHDPAGVLADASSELVLPTLFAFSASLAALWRSWGVEPAAVVGQSMGEISAAYVAGALDLESAAMAVCGRARALRPMLGRGAMLLAEISAAEAERRLRDRSPAVSVAIESSPKQCVLAGERAALDALSKELERERIFCRFVKVDCASHSPYMEPVRASMLEALAGLQPRAAAIPIYSSVEPTILSGTELDARYWFRNLREPVRFAAPVARMLADGFTAFVELSAHPLLSASIEDVAGDLGILPTVVASTRRNKPETSCMVEALEALYTSGHGIAWSRRYAHGNVVSLPSYPWQRKRCWVAAVSPPPPTAAVASAHVLGERMPELAELPGCSQWRQTAAGTELGSIDAAHLVAMLRAAAGAHGSAMKLALSAPSGPLSELQTVLTHGRNGARDQVRVHGKSPRGAFVQLATAELGAFALPQPVAQQANPGHPVCDEDVRRTLAECGYMSVALVSLVRASHSASARVEGQDTALPELAAALLSAAAEGIPQRYEMRGAELLSEGAGRIRRLLVHVRARDPRAVLVDVDAWGEHGAHVAMARGLHLAVVDSGPRDLARARAWLYDLTWRAVAPVTATASDKPRSWLLAPNSELCAVALSAALERHGAQCQRVGLTELSRPDLRSRLERHADRVIVLWPSTAMPDAVAAHEAALAAWRSLLLLWRTLVEMRGPRLWLVTAGAQALGDDAVDPFQASAWGIGRSLALEAPEVFGGMLDLPGHATQGDYAAAARQLCSAEHGEDQLLCRAGRMYAARLQPTAAAPSGLDAPLQLRPDRSYLVTGGLGALGLRIARFLIARGARQLVLTSRSGLQNSGQSQRRQAAVRELTALGAQVQIAQVDARSASAMQRLLREELRAPLAGVVHAAGITDRALATELDARRYDSVWSAKALSAWQLHNLTRELPLDFFVLLGSAAGIWGSAGEAHYAAANHFLDGLAHLRRSQGLPGLCLDFAQWVTPDGMRAHADAANFDDIGLPPMDSLACLAQLEHALATKLTHCVVADVRWEVFRPILEARRAKPLLSELRVSTGSNSAISPPTAAEPQTLDEIRATIREELARVLGPALADRLTPNQRFGELGLESVMAVQLMSRLSERFGRRLGTVLAFEYPSWAQLSECIAEQFGLMPDSALGEESLSITALEQQLARELDRLR